MSTVGSKMAGIVSRRYSNRSMQKSNDALGHVSTDDVERLLEFQVDVMQRMFDVLHLLTMANETQDWEPEYLKRYKSNYIPCCAPT